MDRHVLQEDIAGATAESLKASLYLTMMGAIVSYDPASRTASVQPMQNDPRSNLITGGVVPEPWPVLQHVPVAWPRFGGFMFVGGLNPGDPVTLEAYDLDPTQVIQQGRSQSPVNVGYVRRLSGNFWRAKPEDVVTSTNDTPGAGITIVGVDGDAAQLRFSSGSIQLGSYGGDYLALASKVNLALEQISAMVTAHTHICAAPGSSSGPPTPTPPVFPPPGTFSVGSTLIGGQ